MNDATPFISVLPILVRNIIMLVIKQFHIGSVTVLRSAVLVLCLQPGTNKADQGPVIKPIRNCLTNDIFIN